MAGSCGTMRSLPARRGRAGFFPKPAYRLAQFASLVGLGGYYVGGLNFPTAIIASKDLRY
jgi:hypothetical protein